MDHAQLVGSIDSLPATVYAGDAYRHVATGRSPLSAEGARIVGGRWNPPQSYAVLYLGLDVGTVIAEFHRLAAKQRLAPSSFLPRTLYRYDIRASNLLDLRLVDNRLALDVSVDELAADDPAACRAIGEAAFTCGREGVLAPSATGAGDVLAVFPQRLQGGSAVRDTEAELWEHVPAPEV